MRAGRVVMVGFGQMLLGKMDRLVAPGSVVVIEDPDIVEKRGVTRQVGRLRCVGEVVEAPYHQDLGCVAAVEECLAGDPVTVVLPGLEYGVPAAAALAERWGLPGAGVAAAGRLTDKIALRTATGAAGLGNPEWTQVWSAGDVAEFAAGGPVVLKPANRHASLGVQLLEPGDHLDEAWRLTVGARDGQMLPDRELRWRYLAERVVTGHEYSVEALVSRGEVIFVNVTDKITAGGRHPVELGHTVPAELPGEVRRALRAAMTRLVGAVEFGTGLLHAEWMLTPSGPVLIECAGRVPGDAIVELIDAAYEIDLVAALLAALAGERPELPARAARGSAIRFVTAVPGRVLGVEGLAEVLTRPGVVRAAVSASAGDHIGELRSSWDRLGEVLTTGRDAAQAAARGDVAVAALRVVTVGEPVSADGVPR